MAKRVGKKYGKATTGPAGDTAANVGYEPELWQMADALRGTMDPAGNKHVTTELLFLKYISDALEEQHAQLVADKKGGNDSEDPDEHRARSIFWVPPEARWQHPKSKTRQSTIGELVDSAREAIERGAAAVTGALSKDLPSCLVETRLDQWSILSFVLEPRFARANAITPEADSPATLGDGTSLGCFRECCGGKMMDTRLRRRRSEPN